jgi:hypothetical protein
MDISSANNAAQSLVVSADGDWCLAVIAEHYTSVTFPSLTQSFPVVELNATCTKSAT